MPDQISPGVKQAEDTFKAVAWDGAVTAMLTALGINIWPINAIVRYFTDKLYETLRLALDFRVITFRNKEASDTYAKAVVSLRAIGQAKGYQSKEYLNARQEAENAYNRANRIA